MELKMENKSNPLNITVKSVIDIIFRYKIIVFITFFTCIAFTLVGIQFMTPLYDANVKMLVRGQSVTESETYVPIMARGIHLTQAEIVKSYPVLKRAALALDLHERPLDYEKNFCSNLKKNFIDFMAKRAEIKLQEMPPEKQTEQKINNAVLNLRDRLTVSMLPGTDIFVINVTAFSSEEAIETANIISRSYTMFDQIQQLAEVRIRYGKFHPTVLQLEDSIREATDNLSGKTLPDIQAIGTASVKVIEQATSSGKPVSKPKRLVLAIGLLVAIVVSFGLALMYGFLNRTIKTPQDIIDHLDLPCIGSIPKKTRKEKYLINDESPDTKYYSFYEELSEQLHVFVKTQGLKSLVINSPVYNNSHKYITLNIGYFLSEIFNHKVLLIDANYNNPTFKRLLFPKKGKKNSTGNSGDISPDQLYHKNDLLDIKLIEKSNDKISDVVKNNDLKAFVEQMKNNYDLIIIDTTSINNTKDIARISECSDGIVLVIDEEKINRQMLKNSLPRLTRNKVTIIGGILYNRTFPIPDFIYKYFKYFID